MVDRKIWGCITFEECTDYTDRPGLLIWLSVKKSGVQISEILWIFKDVWEVQSYPCTPGRSGVPVSDAEYVQTVDW